LGLLSFSLLSLFFVLSFKKGEDSKKRKKGERKTKDDDVTILDDVMYCRLIKCKPEASFYSVPYLTFSFFFMKLYPTTNKNKNTNTNTNTNKNKIRTQNKTSKLKIQSQRGLLLGSGINASP